MSRVRSLTAAVLVAACGPLAVQAQLPRHVQVDLLKTEIMGAHDSKSWAVLLTKAAEAKKLGAPAGEMAWFEGKAYFHLKKYADAKAALEVAFKTLKQGSPQYKEALELYTKAGAAETSALAAKKRKAAAAARATLVSRKKEAIAFAKKHDLSLPAKHKEADSKVSQGDRLLKAGKAEEAKAAFEAASWIYRLMRQNLEKSQLAAESARMASVESIAEWLHSNLPKLSGYYLWAGQLHRQTITVDRDSFSLKVEHFFTSSTGERYVDETKTYSSLQLKEIADRIIKHWPHNRPDISCEEEEPDRNCSFWVWFGSIDDSDMPYLEMTRRCFHSDGERYCHSVDQVNSFIIMGTRDNLKIVLGQVSQRFPK